MTARTAATWQDVVVTLRQRNTNPEDWRSAWAQHLSEWDVKNQGPRPIWFPDDDSLENSGIATMMRDRGKSDFPSFYDWSVNQPSEFWAAVIDRLQIKFEIPPTAILDTARGVESPEWLKDASLNIVASCFQAPPDATAVIHGGIDGQLHRVTYAKLQEQVEQVVAGLREANLKAGDHIAIIMPMTVESVAIYLGIVAAGFAAVSIADSFAAPEMERRLQIAKATAVFCSGQVTRAGKTIDVYSRVLAAKAPLSIVVGCNNVPLRHGDQSYEQLLRPAECAMETSLHFGRADATTGILFSSGTTGDPKAIPWDHTTAIRCAADGLLLQDIREGDVVVWPTNLGWMMGPWLIYATLINRGTMGLYQDAPVGEPFGKFVEQAKVTMLGVVPTMVRHWREARSMEAFDWTSIRCFSSTGEASNPEDMFYLSSLADMKPVIEYCGGTEIGGGYISSTVVQPNVPGAFSTAALGSRFVIVNDQDEAADEGTLYLVPPILGTSRKLLNRDHHQTYFADTPRGPNGEILRRHGDYFRRLAGGYYVAGGRVDDTMNLGGIKVSAAEIERAVGGILDISESAAIAVNDGSSGPDRLVIYVVAERGVHSTANDLFAAMNKAIRAQLNPLFKLHDVVVVKELPRTASNKIMRRKLREAYETAGKSA